jgi:hypothetical protein
MEKYLDVILRSEIINGVIFLASFHSERPYRGYLLYWFSFHIGFINFSAFKI